MCIRDRSYPEPNFTIGDSDVRLIKGSSDKNILFIGASHVEQTYPYVEYLNSEYNVYYLTKGGCFITPSYVHPKWSCENIQNYKPIISSVKFDKIVSSSYLLTSHLPLDEPTKSNELKNRVSEYKDFLEFAKANSNEVFIILGEPTGREFDPKLSVRLWLLLQTGDETLDYHLALAKYPHSPQLVEQGGHHAFDSFEQHIPSIIEFLHI